METQSFEEFLTQALDRTLQKEDGRTPSRLEESIRYSLLSPGKRIRPRLLLACAEMLGLPYDSALPAAAAIEMIHCFTLIHDDLPCMDNDDFRRGRPSNHKKFDESTALLAGDALIPIALEVFLTTPVWAPIRLQALRRLLWACGPRGVMGGQAAEAELNQDSTLGDLKQMHRQKTGALFSAALLIPKDLCGIEDQSVEGKIIANFAEELGLAFQVLDDLDDQKQDLIHDTLQMKPLSILFYLSKKEAVESTQKNLSQGIEAIRERWGQKSEKLTLIAQEVLSKLN